MTRGGHELPKVSPGPAKPDPFTSCRQDTPKTALRPFLGWPACRAGSLQSSSTLLDTPRRTPMGLISSWKILFLFQFSIILQETGITPELVRCVFRREHSASIRDFVSWSVGPSVSWSVGPLVGLSVPILLRPRRARAWLELPSCFMPISSEMC
jgi:hypothetical protein